MSTGTKDMMDRGAVMESPSKSPPTPEPPQAPIDAMVAELHRDWAFLPVDDDGWQLVAAYIRQAFGAGYVEGVQDRPPEEQAA